MRRQQFTYDRFGNRRLDPSNTTPDLVGPNPAIDPATNRITGAGYSYDAAGNLTAAPTSSGADTYAYDGENRLALFNGGASMSGGASYGYDGEGRRVEKVAGVVKTVFVYDVQGRLVAEYSSEAAQANGTQYVTQDALGSVRVVTGAGGAVRSRHDYLPFGEELQAGVGGRTQSQGYSQPDGVRQGFTGYEKDSETGLNYAQARYHSPTQGRFTSPDPLLESADPTLPQSWNRYAYVLNNPLLLIDPSGLIWGYRDFQNDDGVWKREFVWFEGDTVGEGYTPFTEPHYRFADGNAVWLAEDGDWGWIENVRPDNSCLHCQELVSEMQNPQTWNRAAVGAIWNVTLGRLLGRIFGRSSASTNVQPRQDTPASTPVGRSGNPIKAQGNTRTVINGREYSGHALDRMQGRGIPPSAVDNTIRHGRASPGNVPGTMTHHDPINNLTVVTDSSTGRVVTVRQGQP